METQLGWPKESRERNPSSHKQNARSPVPLASFCCPSLVSTQVPAPPHSGCWQSNTQPLILCGYKRTTHTVGVGRLYARASPSASILSNSTETSGVADKPEREAYAMLLRQRGREPRATNLGYLVATRMLGFDSDHSFFFPVTQRVIRLHRASTAFAGQMYSTP